MSSTIKAAPGLLPCAWNRAEPNTPRAQLLIWPEGPAMDEHSQAACSSLPVSARGELRLNQRRDDEAVMNLSFNGGSHCEQGLVQLAQMLPPQWERVFVGVEGGPGREVDAWL